MSPSMDPALECQDCGDVVRRLTFAQAQEVAARPYDFITYCRLCVRLRKGVALGM